MKHKSSLVVLYVLVILSMLVAGCAAPATEAPAAPAAPAQTEAPAAPAAPAGAETIKIGILLPLTGQDALEGDHHRQAHEMAVEEINAAGGIACMNGAQLVLVPGDTQGKPEQGNSETERLITKEQVIAIMGSFHTGVTLPTTEVAEKYEVPYIVPNAIAGSITGRGLKYVFKTRIALESYALKTAEYAKEKGALTAVTLTSNITIGEEAMKAWAKTVPEAGIELLDQVVYTSGAPDLTDTILKVKSLDPDVLFAVANTPDAILLTRQMQSLNYWPKMGMINPGGGMADPTYATDLGALSEGVLFAEAWSPLVSLGDGQAINAKFKEKYGYNLAGATATTYVTTHMLAAALEKSCSTDPKALAEVLRTEDFKTGVWNFMFPSGIKFDDKGYVIDPLMVMIQLQGGNPVPIWPAELATGEVVWPVPGWADR